MPRIAHIKTQEDTVIAIWEVTADEEPPATYQHTGPAGGHAVRGAVEKRKRERLGVHHCLEQLGIRQRIRYTSKGKPYLDQGPHISISHSADKVAVIRSRKRQVGIDIQTISTKILKIEPKFIGEAERRFIPAIDKMDYLHIIWGAKESLYKIFGGERPLSFKEDMRVTPFAASEEGQIQCLVRDGDHSERFEGFYRRIKDSYLVYCTALKAAR